MKNSLQVNFAVGFCGCNGFGVIVIDEKNLFKEGRAKKVTLLEKVLFSIYFPHGVI